MKRTDARLICLDGVISCYIVRRLNRFVVEIEVNGRPRQACINNTGRLEEFLIRGRKGFAIPREDGKTDFRLFAIKETGLGAVIDTQLQMRAFEKAIGARLIPYLKGYDIERRNVRLGTSFIDYRLKGGSEELFLEVKSAVLRHEEYAMYPDCPSERGSRHIQELTEYVREGRRAMVMFIAALPKVSAFKPKKLADPELYENLIQAERAGVKVKAIELVYQPKESCIYLCNPDLKVDLS